MKKLLALTLLLGLSFTLVDCTTAYAGNSYHGSWIQIGEKSVDLHGDHDVMVINGWKDTFTKLKLKVIKAPIYVRNIKIVYGNGTAQNFKINKRFAPGEESKALDLPGGHREIKKIVLNYDTINVGHGKSIVRAYGRL